MKKREKDEKEFTKNKTKDSEDSEINTVNNQFESEYNDLLI